MIFSKSEINRNSFAVAYVQESVRFRGNCVEEAQSVLIGYRIARAGN